MYLLAISGGPDSMFLLHKYMKKKIVVAHVNYNKRKDSIKDQLIVENFCKKHNIKIEILNLTKENIKGNFQDWARKERYNFFKIVYKKYNCNKLLLAHHMDDFIETALMQQRTKRFPRFFGIKEKNNLFDMNIYRPFLNIYFKEDIINYLNSKNIGYAIDSSNNQPIFERNKIRIELKEKSKKEKYNIYKWFEISNKILKKKFNRVDKKFSRWKQSDFSLKVFRKFQRDQEEIIFEFLHDNYKDKIKISLSLLKGIVQFIKGHEGNKKYILNNNHYLIKKSNQLFCN